MVIRIDNDNDYSMFLKKADESARNADEFNELIYLYKAAMSGEKDSLYLCIITANQLRNAGYVEAAADILCDVYKKGVRSEILFKALLLCIEEYSKDHSIFEFYNFAYHCKVNPYFYKVPTEMELYESLNDDYHVRVLKPDRGNGFLPFEENGREEPEEDQFLKRFSHKDAETRIESLFERRRRMSEKALKPHIARIQQMMKAGSCSKAVYECEFLMEQYPESESVKAKYLQVRLLDDAKSADEKLEKVAGELENIKEKKPETMESLIMYYLAVKKDLSPLLNEMIRLEYSDWFVVYTVFMILNSEYDKKCEPLLRKVCATYQLSTQSGDYLYLLNMALMERKLSYDEYSVEYLYKLKNINRNVYPVHTMLRYYQEGGEETGLLPDYFPLSLENQIKNNFKLFLTNKKERYENVFLKEAADYTARYDPDLFIKKLRSFSASKEDIEYLESLLTRIYVSDKLKEKIVFRLIAILPEERVVTMLYRFRIKKITLTPYPEIKNYEKKCQNLLFRPLFEPFQLDSVIPSYVMLYPMQSKLSERQFAAALTLLTSDEFEEDVYEYFGIKNKRIISDAVISVQNAIKNKE